MIQIRDNVFETNSSSTHSLCISKEKFDPKTLQPFDRVIARSYCDDEWDCDIFSHINQEYSFPYVCIGQAWKCCIPYNDDTKHLVGTTEEAPEYYRYWEE